MSNWQFQIIKALRRKTKFSVINDQICNRRKRLAESVGQKPPRHPTLLQHAKQRAALAALTYNPLHGTEREQTRDTSCNNRWHHVWVTATNQNTGMPALRWPHHIYEQREWNTSAKFFSEVVYPSSCMYFVRTFSGKFVSSVLISQSLLRIYKYFSTLIFVSLSTQVQMFKPVPKTTRCMLRRFWKNTVSLLSFLSQ